MHQELWDNPISVEYFAEAKSVSLSILYCRKKQEHLFVQSMEEHDCNLHHICNSPTLFYGYKVEVSLKELVKVKRKSRFHVY